MKFLFTAALAALPFAAAQLAPITGLDLADVIADNFIVVMKNDVATADWDSHLSWADGILSANGGSRGHTYQLGDFRGYSANIAQSLVNLLAASDQIAFIEADHTVRTQALVTQNGATWGLARISHRQPGATSYVYDDSAGSGTTAYIIDTGIRTSHRQFEGRARPGMDFSGENNNVDGNGHGTHVAGTTASRDYGVAKRASLVAVKVLGADGSGSNANVIAGIQWAVNDATSNGRVRRSVANMSLGGILSPSTNQAVAAAVQAGLFMAIAAGNSMAPAELFSPASEPTVCTVGATDRNDNYASYTNFGPVVDIFAPGTNITSTWNGSDDDTNTISGTSMATPHVAGLGAYLLALEGERAPEALCSRIAEISTRGALRPGLPTVGLSRNQLAYNGNGA